MDKEKIRNYQIFSIIFTFILGTILHFTYKWSGENALVGIFSAINESTWEHLKLLFFPMLITTIIGFFFLRKDVSNILCAKTVGILIAIVFTVVFFYTYTGVLGKNIAIIDISSFFIATVLGEVFAYNLMINSFKCSNKIATFVLVVLFIMFAVFTFLTPKIGLFKSPI